MMNNGVRAVEMTKHLNEAKAAMNTMTDLERKVLAAMIITMATVWKEEHGYATGKVLAELAMWVKAY